MKKENVVLGLLRISLGWIFFWAFIDKLFGLGFATSKEHAWLNGFSPTAGFLTNAPKGPFAFIYHAMAGSALVDWLFMLGLLLIGLSLILGIGTRIAAYSGSSLLLLIWLAVLPPENNPFMDEHIIYVLLLMGLSFFGAGDYLGLGEWWKKRVKKSKWLV